MNLEQLQGQWQQVKGQIRQQWGKLTDDDIVQSEGNAEKLIGFLTTRYGISKEKARNKLATFLENRDQSGLVHALSMGADRVVTTTANAAKSSREFARQRPVLTTSLLLALGAWLGYRLFR